jgi:ABC-type multidrug transport system fused ATPase/permease subunit
MAKTQTQVVKRSLFSWILPGNKKLHLMSVLIITIMVLARVLPLEMQKRIVNHAIEFKNLQLLMTYCGIYLAAVVGASGLKYLNAVLTTLIAQRTTAKMRIALFQYILDLPLSFYRKTQPGLVVNSLSNELNVPGDFVGMSVAVPATNIFTLLALGAYLIWLNPLLAILSYTVFPLVVFLIPRLQKKVNRANSKRVDAERLFSARINEAVLGIHEIQAHGGQRIENRRCYSLVNKLTKIRIVWSFYRFAIKSVTSFSTSLGPFIVFILGGYLTIKGQMELGALVAFLSAQDKLYDPWKELVSFYQVFQDGRVAYKRTMEYFDLEPDHELEPKDRAPLVLDGGLQINNLSYKTEDGIFLLKDINLSLNPGEQLALVGFSGSGKSTLALCIGQLYKYSGGSVLIGDREVSKLTRKDIVQNIGVVAQNPFIFDGTIEENLLYASRAQADEADGNGQENTPELPTLDDIVAVLQQIGIFTDVMRFGLETILSPDQHAELAKVILRVRRTFQQDFGEELADYVEFFDENRYLYFSSVAENLIFGTPQKEEFSDKNLPENPYFLKFMDLADMTRPLLSLGAQLCMQTVDILGSLPPDAIFFEQSPIVPEELDDYKILLEKLRTRKLNLLSAADRQKLLELALRFTPGRHKMVALPNILETLILEGRALFREKISSEDPHAVTFYQMDSYMDSQTIISNIFFGKNKASEPIVQDKINMSIVQLLIEEDLLSVIIETGLHYNVGSKGDRLSGGQKQKLAIGRVFLKAPKILLMDEATSALDNKAQSRIQNLLETRWKKKSMLISVTHRLDTLKSYDKIAVMKAGKIVETGTYDELIARKGSLYELCGRY